MASPGDRLPTALCGYLALVALTFQCVTSSGRYCRVPENATVWESNPFMNEVVVMWAYGNNYTCHAQATCHGDLVDPEDELYIAESDRMVVQLMPVELQLGNSLRFTPSSHMGTPFHIDVYRVDEEGFLTCNISGGVSISPGFDPTNESFVVPQDMLEFGSNYFIASNMHPLVSCHMGERVNVTLKGHTCAHQEHGTFCSGFGNCLTRRGEPSYHCSCCDNYRGDTCEIFDSCLSNPCHNGGLCVHESDNFHRFTCNCPLGYFGEYCQERAHNLCNVVRCENQGTCIGNSTHFVCNCPPGVTGTHCEVDVNDCEGSPCHHGLCEDLRAGFRCYCEPGYAGHTCAEPLRPCELSPCRHNSFCEDIRAEDIESAFRCHCKPGWTGKDCTVKIPACDPNPCSPHGACTEFNDTYICSCAPGYTGTHCEININECDPNPCMFGGHCRDGINSHSCLCIHSHAGSNCQYTLDMFSPVLDEVDAQGHVIHDPAHVRNLYIVAGCLTGVVVTALLVLVICYCRVGELCRRGLKCWPWGRGLSHFWYKQQLDDGKVISVDVTNASDCPLHVDSFWPGPAADPSQLPNRVAFGNQTV